MHLTEGRNTGFGKILRALAENGSPKPLFETDDERTSFATTIFIHSGFYDGSTTASVVDGVVDITSVEKQVLDVMKLNPILSAKKIAKVIGVSERTVQRHQTALKKKGYIDRNGSDREGVWLILK